MKVVSVRLQLRYFVRYRVLLAIIFVKNKFILLIYNAFYSTITIT